MVDYIPKVTELDVKRIINREFPNHKPRKIWKILNDFSSESNGIRVYLAAIKMSNGNTEMLKDLIKTANIDLRDVIAPAEYPRFLKEGFNGVEKLDKKELQQLKEDDWNQYQEWLNKKS